MRMQKAAYHIQAPFKLARSAFQCHICAQPNFFVHEDEIKYFYVLGQFEWRPDGIFNFCQVNFVNEWERCTNVRLHRVIASVQNSIPINYYRSNRNCVYYYLSYFCMKWNIFFPLYMRWWMKHSVPHKQQNLPCRICCIWAFSPTHCQLCCCVFSYWSNSCNIKAT